MTTRNSKAAATKQAPDFGKMLAKSIEQVQPDAIEKAAEAQADAAAIAAPPKPPVPPKEAAPKKKGTRGADRVLAHPAGPQTKYPDKAGTDASKWVVPTRDSFIVAMAKLMAFRPGLTNAQISEIIHPVPKGEPTREGTTSVYYTWDLPRAGFGVERKAGGMHLVMPTGHPIEEIKDHPSPKLGGLLLSQGRTEILDDIQAYNESRGLAHV